MGERLGCLVCAEVGTSISVISHNVKVACNPKAVRISPHEAKLRNLPQNSDPELPKGYIVAEENDCVCVKYVLVYKDFGTFTTHTKKTNICQLLAILYVLLLVCLWVARSPEVRHYYTKHFGGGY